MTLLDFGEMDLDSGHEPVVVEGGQEYKLRIVGVTSGTDKNEMDYLMPRLEIVEEPYAKELTKFLHIPNRDEMDEKRLDRARYAMSSFCDAFGIERSGEHNPEDVWPGHEGWAILGVSDNEEFGEQNFIRKVLAPK